MAQAPQGESTPRRGSGTVLLVEDNATILTLFSGTLKQEGFAVLTASSAQEAIQICKQHNGQIDLLLTDILLPNTGELQIKKDGLGQRRMSGMDCMREVRALRPDVRVILMSGRSDEDLKALGVFKEGWPLLRKPLRLETLVNTVHQMLGSSARI